MPRGDDDNFVALTTCFFCQEAGCLLLATRFTQDGKAVGHLGELHGKVVNMIPCSKCEALMQQGIMIISVRDGEFEGMERERKKHKEWREHAFSENPYRYRNKFENVPGFIPNPYRTGVMMVMKEDRFEEVFCDSFSTPGLIANVKRWRWTFMEDAVCELVGLYDLVDKPDEVPYRVDCKRKGLDPREQAIKTARGERKADGKKEAKAPAEGGVPEIGEVS